MKFTEEEIKEIKAYVIDVINEGVSTPPYRSVVYDLIEKLGITQDEAYQYDISRPSAAKVKIPSEVHDNNKSVNYGEQE